MASDQGGTHCLKRPYGDSPNSWPSATVPPDARPWAWPIADQGTNTDGNEPPAALLRSRARAAKPPTKEPVQTASKTAHEGTVQTAVQPSFSASLTTEKQASGSITSAAYEAAR